MNEGPYEGAAVVFATMHGKERLVQKPFRDILGADVIAPQGIDTDQFGTFSGEIERTLTPQAAARVKAKLGTRLAGVSYGLASEGSFSSGLGIVGTHLEILIFIDQDRGLELFEGSSTPTLLPPRATVTDIDVALAYATRIGHPEQGLILHGGEYGELIEKNLSSTESISTAVSRLLGEAPGYPLVASPDYRAHRCPSRAKVITALAHTMAERLATLCPACATPGLGRVDVERGLRCSDCGQATGVIAADIFGCGGCRHAVRVARGPRSASPQWCDRCNP